MIPRDHLIASLILAAICYPFLGINAALIIIGGFLIDVDHYLMYIAKHKSLSLQDAYKWHVNLKTIKPHQRQNKHLYIFHTAEFMLLLAILSFHSSLFAIFLGGVALHVILDMAYDAQHRKEVGRAHSLIMWLLKRDIKKAGL